MLMVDREDVTFDELKRLTGIFVALVSSSLHKIEPIELRDKITAKIMLYLDSSDSTPERIIEAIVLLAQLNQTSELVKACEKLKKDPFTRGGHLINVGDCLCNWADARYRDIALSFYESVLQREFFASSTDLEEAWDKSRKLKPGQPSSRKNIRSKGKRFSLEKLGFVY
jgi:hypothetical protein